jgi:DNA (cytosine-5)-methyltransferase 1
VTVCGGLPVGLLWASPDCKHFSKAKGGKPVSKKIRSLAGVVVKWAAAVRPRVVCLENVEEFKTWGPLTSDGRPCPVRKGQTFKRWVAALQRLGYQVEWRELRACDYGAPTIRKRLFVVARCDGQPIVWPEQTHASKPARSSGLKPWRTAAECIDWTLPVPSIFERDKPLAEATLRRIAHGIKRYVLDDPQPFVVRIGHTGHGDGGKVRSIRDGLSTVTSKAEHCLVVAYLAKHFGGEPQVGKTCADLRRPAPTVTAVDHSSLVTATVRAAAPDEDLGHAEQVYALLLKYYGTDQAPRLDEPLHTVTTRDRFALVTVRGTRYVIADIGMRMLQPRELYTAQGFPSAYRIDRGADGVQLPKSAQVRMCGNSVAPPVATALVRSNYCELPALRRAA